MFQEPNLLLPTTHVMITLFPLLTSTNLTSLLLFPFTIYSPMVFGMWLGEQMGIEKGKDDSKLALRALGGYVMLFYLIYQIASFSQ